MSYFRTDFMGDMASVSSKQLDDQDTDSSLSRFGGGFELMKDGGDKDGIWTLLESSLQ